MKELCYANNPKSLFRKYAYLITTLARKHAIFREFVTRDSSLVVPKNVNLLLPNGYHEVDGKQGRLTVTTRPIYSPHLFPILQKIDLYAPYIRNFQEAQEMIMFLTRETKQKPDFIPYREMPRLIAEVMFTTTTFNPDVDPESTSVDGIVRNDLSAPYDTWAVVHDATTGTTVADNIGGQASACITVRSSDINNGNWRGIHKSAFLFDTSSLSGATITAATFSIYINYVSADTFDQNIDVVSSSPASNTSLSTSDFDQFGTTVFSSVDIGTLGSGTYPRTPNVYSDFTLDTNGQNNINISGGISKFGIRDSSDRANTAPTWSLGKYDYVSLHFADNGSNEPKLVVTYTLSFTQMLSEVVTLSDSISHKPAKNLSEMITITDSLIRKSFVVFSEIVNLIDSIVNQIVFSKALSEVIMVIDSIGNWVISKVLVETVSIVDSITKSGQRVFSEVVTIVDSVIRVPGRVLSETITITDSILTQIGRVLSEVIAVADSMVAQRQFFRTLSEAVTIVDSIVKKPGKVLSETVMIVDKAYHYLNGFLRGIWTRIAKPTTTWTKQGKP